MSLISKISWWVLLLFILILLSTTLEYLDFRFDTYFLRLKGSTEESLLWKSSYIIHIFGGVFCLGAGILQFKSSIRKNYVMIHRKLGMVYIITTITTAITGIIISMYSLGDFSSRIAFHIGFILMPVFAIQAFIQVKKHNYQNHFNAMTRSFAQACSIIPFRIYVAILSMGMGMNFSEAFNFCAWPALFTIVAISEFLIWKKVIKI